MLGPAYTKANALRPGQAASSRALAYLLLRRGAPSAAFEAPEQSTALRAKGGLAARDIGIIGRAWVAREPDRRAEVETRLAKVGAKLGEAPSLLVVLTWETDASDVDLGFRSDPPLFPALDMRSRDGFGPEAFAFDAPPPANVELSVYFARRGPQGDTLGSVHVVEHDGQGGIREQQMPFVLMQERSHVALGSLTTR